MRGYHYTTPEAWERIQREGLRPIMQPEHTAIGVPVAFVWPDTPATDDLDEFGHCLWTMLHHYTREIVVLEVDYTLADVWHGGKWEWFHTGTLSTTGRPPMVYHEDKLGHPLVNTVPPSRVRLHETYRLGAT